tara:strand:+ start:548 stop:739 length:192 start_codon:yes stop_codon:yes gene_type:complete
MSDFLSHFFRWGNSEKVVQLEPEPEPEPEPQPEPEPEPEPEREIETKINIKGTRLDIEKEVIE